MVKIIKKLTKFYDLALRLAILKSIQINFLISKSNQSNSFILPSLKGIQSFSSICNDKSVCNGTFNVRVIEFPTPNQDKFMEKYTTFNNPKFVISDSEWVYISTSNWNQNSFYNVSNYFSIFDLIISSSNRILV